MLKDDIKGAIGQNSKFGETMTRTKNKNPAAVDLGLSGGKTSTRDAARARFAKNARRATCTALQGGKGPAGASKEKHGQKKVR
jgi:hypothetical protein